MPWIFLILPLFLAGCFVEEKETKQQTTECFNILPETETIRPIMWNKCTGETWMLIYTNLIDEKGNKTGKFTYRWSPLSSNYGEAEMSLRH